MIKRTLFTILIAGATHLSAQEVKIDVVQSKLQLPTQDSLKQVTDNLPQKSVVINPIMFNRAYHNSLGFFCQAENKLAKSARIPVKMRLGTVQYVDKIEGK